MITGCAIDVLDDKYKYAKVFENSPQAVDILEIIDFYKEITENNAEKEDVAKEIREYALDNVSMKSALAPVIDYIES